MISRQKTPYGQRWIYEKLKELGLPHYQDDSLAERQGECVGVSVLSGQAFVTNHKEDLKRRTAVMLQANLAQEEQFDLLVFWTCVDIIQNPEIYLDVFAGPRYIHTSSLLGLPFITSVAAEMQGGLYFFSPFTGSYDHSQLVNYLSSLQAVINKDNKPLPHPFTLVLRAEKHAIMIAFDKTTQSWNLVNADKFKVKEEKNSDKFATKIAVALKGGDIAIFATSVMTTQTSKSQIENILLEWKKQPQYIDIHQMTLAKINRKNSHGVTWLSTAILEQSTEDVLSMLKQSGVDISYERDGDKATPLFLAALMGNVVLVRALIQYGADVDHGRSRLTSDGMTPLMIACIRGYVDVVSALLQLHADPNLQRNDGATAIYLASTCNQPEVVDILLQRNDIDISLRYQPSGYSLTPLDIAKWRGFSSIVQTLERYEQQCLQKRPEQNFGHVITSLTLK